MDLSEEVGGRALLAFQEDKDNPVLGIGMTPAPAPFGMGMDRSEGAKGIVWAIPQVGVARAAGARSRRRWTSRIREPGGGRYRMLAALSVRRDTAQDRR